MGLEHTDPNAAEMSDTPSEAPRKSPWLRIGLLLVVIATVYGVASATDMLNDVSMESIKALVAQAGVWGFVAFVGLFAAGLLVQAPGMLFIAAGILVYGQLLGGVLGMVGAMAALSINFVVVRAIGGKSLGAIKNKWMIKILARLDRSPICTIAILRVLFQLSPPVTYALAMSNIRFREYIVGSFLGLLAPIAAASIFFNCIFA